MQKKTYKSFKLYITFFIKIITNYFYFRLKKRNILINIKTKLTLIISLMFLKPL